MNPFQNVRLDKVTLNAGVGTAGERLANAKTLLERLTDRTAVITLAKTRNPTWKTRKGDEIGVKVTLRGKPAAAFLNKALDAVERTLSPRAFDRTGNVAFGVKEYIDFPGVKYDPQIGMMGFDVSVTLEKAGARVARRRVAPRRVPQRQRVSKAEAQAFLKSAFNAKLEEPEAR